MINWDRGRKEVGWCLGRYSRGGISPGPRRITGSLPSNEGWQGKGKEVSAWKGNSLHSRRDVCACVPVQGMKWLQHGQRGRWAWKAD